MPETKILVVEDDEVIMNMLCLRLEREGFAVLRAADGEEGLRALSEGGVGMMITDCLMPKLDGFKLVKKARSFDEFKEIPIVMMSAVYRKVNYYNAAREAGADLFVVKPFRLEELLENIRRLLGK